MCISGMRENSAFTTLREIRTFKKFRIIYTVFSLYIWTSCWTIDILHDDTFLSSFCFPFGRKLLGHNCDIL